MHIWLVENINHLNSQSKGFPHSTGISVKWYHGNALFSLAASKLESHVESFVEESDSQNLEMDPAGIDIKQYTVFSKPV